MLPLIKIPLFLLSLYTLFSGKSEAIPIMPLPKASCHAQDIEKNQGTSGKIISLREAPCKENFYQMETSSDNPIEAEVLKFQEESLEKVSTLLKTQEFQTAVEELKKSQTFPGISDSGTSRKGENLFIFVSFSLGEKALENLAHEAKRYGATLVLRGFMGGSYLKTVKSLEKIIRESGQGFIIDPELFTLFPIQTIPSYILTKPFPIQSEERTQTPIHDRLQGHVSIQYALEAFAKDGDLKDEAKSLLRKGESK